MVKVSGFSSKDRTTGKEGYILACALLFGNEVTVFTYFPAYRTDADYRKMNYHHYLNSKSSDPDDSEIIRFQPNLSIFQFRNPFSAVLIQNYPSINDYIRFKPMLVI